MYYYYLDVRSHFSHILNTTYIHTNIIFSGLPGNLERRQRKTQTARGWYHFEPHHSMRSLLGPVPASCRAQFRTFGSKPSERLDHQCAERGCEYPQCVAEPLDSRRGDCQ